MGGANSWRQIQDGADWMREVEKRVLHEERRPGITTASDLLGPGVGPFSVPILDWNAPETAFNGFFHSEPGAINVPIAGHYWMGTSQATNEGFGLQRVVEYTGPPVETISNDVWTRRFYTVPGSQRQFSTWKVEQDTGWLEMTNWASGWTSPTTYMWQAREIRNKVYLRGNVRNATFTGQNITIATLPPGITLPPLTAPFVITGSPIYRYGSVLSAGGIQITSMTADTNWYQIIGSYFTD
jgi:hypothetical protein